MRSRATLACLLWGLCLPAAAAASPGSFSPESDAWDGLGELYALVGRLGTPVSAPERLDLWELSPNDALLIVHPTRSPPAGELARFMREGGRVALLDDYGQGQALLRTFRIGRHAAMRPPEERRLRGNAALAVATPTGRHPLTEGVEALVLNHGQTLHHSSLEPVLRVGDDGASALTGAVGAGRLVAVSDASVVINNMLQFDGNRRFAENLVGYLVGDRGGTLYLVAGDAEIRGRPGVSQPRDVFVAVQEGLRRMAALRLPPGAVWWMAWVVAIASCIAAATALPRRARGGPPLPASGGGGGFAGRVAFFEAPERNLYGAALAYKFELESALVQRLGLPKQPSRADVVEALQSRPGVPAVAERLLSELDALSLQQGQRPSPPHIDAKAFQGMVEDGARLLRSLDQP